MKNFFHLWYNDWKLILFNFSGRFVAENLLMSVIYQRKTSLDLYIWQNQTPFSLTLTADELSHYKLDNFPLKLVFSHIVVFFGGFIFQLIK